MSNLLLILIAIILEVCGDACIRIGLRGHQAGSFLIGAGLVIGYGMVISLPKWTFGRTMGIYIAVFFIVSQVVARVMLHEHVRLPTIVGGVLIVSGGLVILLWRAA